MSRSRRLSCTLPAVSGEQAARVFSFVELTALVAALTGLLRHSKMITIVSLNLIEITIVGVKYEEKQLMTPEQVAQALLVGERIARLRIARNVRQADAAVRAGLSRPTATRIEAGDPGRTLAQVLRYLGAVAPGMTLLQLLRGDDSSIVALAEREKRQRVRVLSDKELKRLDF